MHWIHAAHSRPLPRPPWTSLIARVPGTGRMEPLALPTWHLAGVCLRSKGRGALQGVVPFSQAVPTGLRAPSYRW